MLCCVRKVCTLIRTETWAVVKFFCYYLLVTFFYLFTLMCGLVFCSSLCLLRLLCFSIVMPSVLLSAFGALTVGRQEEHPACRNEWWGVAVVVCLKHGADCVSMVQLMPLHSKTSSCFASLKSEQVLPFWSRRWLRPICAWFSLIEHQDKRLARKYTRNGLFCFEPDAKP